MVHTFALRACLMDNTKVIKKGWFLHMPDRAFYPSSILYPSAPPPPSFVPSVSFSIFSSLGDAWGLLTWCPDFHVCPNVVSYNTILDECCWEKDGF